MHSGWREPFLGVGDSAISEGSGVSFARECRSHQVMSEPIAKQWIVLKDFPLERLQGAIVGGAQSVGRARVEVCVYAG